MHITKFKANQLGQILKHIERPKEREYANKNINLERSNENYDLISGDINKINERINEVKHFNRSDVVKLVGIVVTLPKDYKGNQEKFFEKTTQVFSERYGEKNIAYATVHKDEKTPHIHLGVIPITKDKDGQERLCAKNLFDKNELQRLHPEIEKELNKHIREPVHLLNKQTERNRETGQPFKDVKEMKKELAKEEKELPKGIFGVDFKKAYEQEREKNISKSLENKELEREHRSISSYCGNLERKLEKFEKNLKEENMLRNELQERLNDIEQLRQRLQELEREERKQYEREKNSREER